jgi:beta-glucosidase
LLAGLGIFNSQLQSDPDGSVENRVNDILSQMTLEEKIDYIGGVDDFFIREIPRLGLPKIKMSDGPVGASSADIRLKTPVRL